MIDRSLIGHYRHDSVRPNITSDTEVGVERRCRTEVRGITGNTVLSRNGLASGGPVVVSSKSS